uniref:NADH:flavin oxidoreductase/NADH oxidase N-terminal domain-containing protein n=1 Tax=Lotharella oceanica TaxID=641309 RepID=A0A7S2X6W7_9EUKA
MADKKSNLQLMSEFSVGGQKLKNRVVLAPLTRARCTPTKDPYDKINKIPNDIMGDYYEQRASGGLIITEATAISAAGCGWLNAPWAVTEEQMAGWKKIVDRVHKANGIIYLQLWHMGRQSHSSFHPDTKEILSASAIAVGSGQASTAFGTKADYEKPRAMTLEEIKQTVQDYKACAARAKAVGFDGVEIHSANGYLIDQFMQACSNKRTDKYGGSMENRVRLLVEVIEAIAEVYPANRIGFRLSPNGAYGGMGSEDNAELFPFVAKAVEKYGLAYLHLMDGLGFGFHGKCKVVTAMDMRRHFSGPIIANVGLTKEMAEGMVRSGAVDLAAFGRLYISNPDLPERFENGWPLAESAPYETWWRPTGAKGYTDWPKYKKPAEKTDKEEAKA